VLSGEVATFSDDLIVIRGSEVKKRSAGFKSQGLEPKDSVILQKQVGKPSSRGYNKGELADPCMSVILEPDVIGCVPNHLVRIADHSVENSTKLSREAIANHQFNNIRASVDSREDDTDVVVAVIDTGVDYNHKDLNQYMWRNPGEIPANGVDDDANGYIDDVFGANTADGTGDPMDHNGHGTHIAGIITKVASEQGTTSPKGVKIMALRFLDAKGLGGLFSAIKALQYVVDMKHRGVNIRISNNSWGGAPFSDVLHSAIEMTANADIAFVSAAGNFGVDNDEDPEYPASIKLPNVVAVAAIDDNHNLALFSNYGEKSVHIAAPGVNISSTFLNNTYRRMSGTSMSAPIVSGLLVRQFDFLKKGKSIVSIIDDFLVHSPASQTLAGLVIGSKHVNYSYTGTVDATTEPASTIVEPEGQITRLVVRPLLKVRNKGTRGARERTHVTGLGIRLSGKGNYASSLRVRFGSELCDQTVDVQLVNGKGRKDLRFNRLLRSVPAIEVYDINSGLTAKVSARQNSRAFFKQRSEGLCQYLKN
jgi:hypothetical protein